MPIFAIRPIYISLLTVLLISSDVNIISAQRSTPPSDKATTMSSDTFVLMTMDEMFLEYDTVGIDIDSSFHRDEIGFDRDHGYAWNQIYLLSDRPQTYNLKLYDRDYSTSYAPTLYPIFSSYFRKSPEQSRFWVTNNTFSDILYFQANQQQSYLAIDFARHFHNGTDFALTYTNSNDEGTYDNESLRHNNIGLHWRFNPQNERIKWQVHYYGNFTNNRQNGGVLSSSTLDDPDFSERLSVDVLASGDEALEHEDHTFQSKVHYAIFRDHDSPLEKSSLVAYYAPSYTIGRIKYGDPRIRINDGSDTLYNIYDIDSSIVNYELSSRAFNHDLGLIIRKGVHANVSARIAHETFDQVQDSLLLTELEADDLSYLNASIRGVVEKDFRWLAMLYRGEFGRQRDQNTYLHHIQATIPVTSQWALYGIAETSRKLPNILHVMQETWRNPMEVTSSSFVAYRQNSIHTGIQMQRKENHGVTRYIDLFLSYQNFEDYLYHDTESSYIQANESENLFQAGIRCALSVGQLNFNHFSLYSRSDKDLVRRPTWSHRTRISWNQRLFQKRLHMNIGLQNTVIADYDLYYYNPWIQGFQLGEKRIDENWKTDIFLNLNVRSFKFMLMAENISQLFTDKTIFYFERYPIRDFGIRFGVNWVFKD